MMKLQVWISGLCVVTVDYHYSQVDSELESLGHVRVKKICLKLLAFNKNTS